MVAGRGKRVRHSLEQILAVVFNPRCFAVHHPIIYNHFRTEGVADALVAQADAKDRNAPAAELADDLVREAGLTRRAGAGGHENALRLQLAYRIERNLIVPPHLQLDVQLAEVLHEVIGERIVIVYDQDHEWKNYLTVPALQITNPGLRGYTLQARAAPIRPFQFFGRAQSGLRRRGLFCQAAWPRTVSGVARNSAGFASGGRRV